MSRLARVREKVRRDQALNLTELALVTDYDRNTLGAMLLPLQGGKIFYTDFRRIIAARQDRHELSLSVLTPQASETTLAASSSPAEATPTTIAADKFRAPKSKGVPLVASRARAESQPHSTELQRKRA